MKPPVLHFSFLSEGSAHECRIELGWFGAERYYIDNELVFKQRSLVGKNVQIRSYGREIQVNSWLERRQAVMEIRVDGNLLVENLLADYNKELRRRLGVTEDGKSVPLSARAWAMKVALWLVLAVFLFIVFRATGANAA